jgi:alpha-tubulin suppressor-like RCC1 family protein
LGRNSEVGILVNPSTIYGEFSGEHFASVGVGTTHAVFMTGSGKVYGCGSADQGKLGLNGTVTSPTVGTLTPMIDGNNVLAGKTIISAKGGSRVSVLLTSDGKVYTTGSNNLGGLGVPNSNTQHDSPKPISDNNGVLVGKSVASISVGSDAVLLVTSDGLLRAFGFNGNYQLGDGSNVYHFTPIAPSPTVFANRFIVQASVGVSHALALQSDGTVLSWALNAGVASRSSLSIYPGVIDDPSGHLNSKVIHVSAGNLASILITEDGRGFGFGYNSAGQLCTGNTNNQEFVAPFANNSLFFTKAQTGADVTLLLTSDGKVYACGSSSFGQTGLNRTSPGALVPTELTILHNLHSGVAVDVGVACNGRSMFVVMNASTTVETTSVAPTVAPNPASTILPIAPLVIVRKVSLSTTLIGDSSKIPQPTSGDALVLFASTDGNSKSQIGATPESYFVSSRVLKATYTFNVASVSSAVSIEMVSSDGKKVTVNVATSGTVNVDLSTFFTSAPRRGNQVIIGGKPITFTMNVLTPNVPANIAKTSATVTLEVETLSVGVASSLEFLTTVILAIVCLFVST